MNILTSPDLRESFRSYISPTAQVDWSDTALPACPIRSRSPGLEANHRYFGHPEWARSYFKYRHRSERFRRRWQAACGSWDDKIVVDIGCGPGNVFATVGGRPKLLIGVDVAKGSLEMASEVGYQPMLADAHALPFVSGFADLVVMNATLHHCDDMACVLAEASRLVALGGILVTDHDPQLTAWKFRGPAKWAWQAGITSYLWPKKGYHRSGRARVAAFRSEIHNAPGRGVTPQLYESILKPRGFNIELHPHNHSCGASALHGNIGRSGQKHRLTQLLSGINPDSRMAALSILCRAVKVRTPTDRALLPQS